MQLGKLSLGLCYALPMNLRNLFLLLCFCVSALQAAAQPKSTEYVYDGIRGIHVDTVSIAPADKPDTTQQVKLPDVWSKSSRTGLWVYSFSFTTALSARSEMTALYIPRLGNRFIVELNGVALMQNGALKSASQDYSRQPQYVLLPDQLIGAGANNVKIQVFGDPGRYAGLSSFDLGPREEIYKKYRIREVTQFWFLYAVLGLALFFAFLSIGLWRATRQALFAFFTLACLFASIRLLSYLLTEPPLPVDWWTFLVEASHVSFIVCISLFGVWLLDLPRRIVYSLTALMLITGALTIPMYAFLHLVEYRQYVTLALLLYGTSVSCFIWLAWYKRRDVPSALLALAAAITALFGVYDHFLVFYSADGYASFTISRFTFAVFLFAMGYIIVLRFTIQAKYERSLREQLAIELGAKSTALDLQFQEQEHLLKIQAQSQERERLVRDIHDGMGLHLSGILGMIENNAFSQNALRTEVRTAIDHMRLLVNNSESFEGDWLMLFGTLRHHIETRLKRFDIKLTWLMPVENMPTIQIQPMQASAVQRLFFELTTNVIKHSQAKTIHVSIEFSSSAFVIRYTDDGIGFDISERTQGLGTRSILHRVTELNATITVESQPNKGVGYLLIIPT